LSEHPDVYGPICAKEIRLLKFLPASTGDNEICCNLTVYPFNQVPPYVALSYNWGNPKPASQITLCGSSYEVGPNLKAALLRLQGWDSKENYWIDALCIDQSNFDERSDQVLLMGDIYTQCKFVFIWLGEEESTYSARALSFIK
jgi:hypothetical protein